jgi:hypothetical protein
MNKADRFRSCGADVDGDRVVLYRGGNVDEATLRQLRYGDYLSAVRDGQDATGNSGAADYGNTVIRVELPLDHVEVTGAGEFLYKGPSTSLDNGHLYPAEIYRAYNDVYGSNYTAAEIDGQTNVRAVASQGLAGGREEFDALMQAHGGPAEGPKNGGPRLGP